MEIPHILIAEDDPDTRELLDLVLRRAGFRVSVTDDASQLLSVLAADQVDVLLLDYQMPKMSGIELRPKRDVEGRSKSRLEKIVDLNGVLERANAEQCRTWQWW